MGQLDSLTDAPDLKGHDVVIDTETSGLKILSDKPFMVQIKLVDDEKEYAFGWSKNTARYLNDQLPYVNNLIAHNMKFDAHMMVQGGVRQDIFSQIPLWCTYVVETLLNDKPRYSLGYLGYNYFGVVKENKALFEWMFEHLDGCKSEKQAMGRLLEAPIELVVDYGLGDISITEMLFKKQQPRVKIPEWKNDLPLKNTVALEMDVLPVLVNIERRGVPIDTDTLPQVSKVLHDNKRKLSEDIRQLAGFDVNPGSGKQMERAFENLDLPIFYNKPTKTMLEKLKDRYGDDIPQDLLNKGNPSFSKEIMEGIDHPFPEKILQLRSVRKMIDTFVDGMEQYINEDTGRIHTNFNQTRGENYGTGTGRLSANDPNLQQIPNPKRGHKEMAKAIRSLFKDTDGGTWVSGDWDQFEDRIFANFSEDDALLARYKDDPDIDFHGVVAEMCSIDRTIAKQINLGGKFGMGRGLLAKKLGLPYTTKMVDDKLVTTAGDEANALFDKYHAMFPNAKMLLNRAENLARQRGYIKTLVGRKIRFKHGGFHKAGGLIFQGNAADIMKQKMVELENEFDPSEAELILPVHDEFNFIVREKSSKVMKAVKEIMEDVPQLDVPIRASIGKGENWYEASV